MKRRESGKRRGGEKAGKEEEERKRGKKEKCEDQSYILFGKGGFSVESR